MSALLREGDVVSINGVVQSGPIDFDGKPKIKIRVEPYHDIFVLVSDLTVVRHDFHVGDRVTWTTHDGADSVVGEVLAIANDHLWVEAWAGIFATVWVGKATRVDPEPVRAPDMEELGVPAPTPRPGDIYIEAESGVVANREEEDV